MTRLSTPGRFNRTRAAVRAARGRDGALETGVKLTNFELKSGVELSGLGVWWDLHNWFDFSGLELLPEQRAARLHWTVGKLALEQGTFGQANPLRNCAIRFDDVSAVLIRRVKDGTDPKDSDTLQRMTLVAPMEKTPSDSVSHGVRVPSADADGQFLFEFMDGFDIEVAAETATLESESFS